MVSSVVARFPSYTGGSVLPAPVTCSLLLTLRPGHGFISDLPFDSVVLRMSQPPSHAIQQAKWPARMRNTREFQGSTVEGQLSTPVGQGVSPA